MKQKIWILPFICLALALPLSAAESPLEGWTPVEGEWKKVKKGVSTAPKGVYRMRWDGEAKAAVQIEFYMTVRQWGPEHQMAGIIWAGSESGSYKQPRNMATVIGHRAKLAVWSYAQKQEDTFPCTIPLNTRIPFQARISKRALQIAVGRTKATVSIAADKLNHIFLFVYDAEVEFNNIKIKAK